MGIRITSTSGGGSFKVRNQGSGGTFKATGNTGDTSGVSDWVRPSDWLEMPTIGTQEFIGLLAITDDESNRVALLAQGAYTVDWGDGVVENVASNAKAEHTYTYSSISDSTISSRGYKQVIVRVTPQAGQNLTLFSLHQRHSSLTYTTVTSWLEFAVNGSNITSLAFGASVNAVYHGMVEKITIGTIGALTSCAHMFSGHYSLQSINLFNTASSGVFLYMFANCYALKTVPLYNTSAGTTFWNMFVSCISLQAVPLFDVSQGGDLSGMFSGCHSLKEIPLFNLKTTGTVSTGGMFGSCYSLKTIPLLNTSAVTNFSGMFSGCLSLKTIPLLNTSAGTNFSLMFSNCPILETIPLIDTSQGTLFNGMFQSCNKLLTIPLLNTAKGTNFSNMFVYSYIVQYLPNLNTASGSSFGSMLNSTSIAKAAFQGTRYSISYGSMYLYKNAVMDIFNGLGTASGSQTITITTNPAFAATTLNVAPGTTWRGVTIQSSSQDVYASNQSTGLVYKQTGGVGPFVSENPGAGGWTRGLGTDIYGNIYLASAGTGLIRKLSGSNSWVTISTTGITGAPQQVAGDSLGNLYVGTATGAAGLFKQTALTGSFVQVFTGNCASLSISPVDNSVYVTDGGGTGTIYKQTGGSGSFNAVQNIPYSSLLCMPNGDVYASNGTLYKQTAGTGSFVSMGILAGSSGMVNKPDGNLYVVGGDVAFLDFNQVVTPTDRLIAINKGWTVA